MKETMYLKEELKRAFLSKSTLLSFILAILCIFAGCWQYLYFIDPDNNFLNALLAAHSSGTMSIISLVFPIIVSLPFAASYVIDLQSGVAHYIHIRIGRVKYCFIRLFVNGIVSGAVLSVSFLILFFTLLIVYGPNVNGVFSHETVIFKEIHDKSPIVYTAILILNTFICGIVFSTLGLGISTFIKNKYLAVLTPFLCYLFSGTILVQVNKFFHLGILFDWDYYNDLQLSTVLISYIIIFLIGIGLFLFGALKKGEDHV
ncbi:hypothetical protein MRP26_27460 [Bacillus sp. CCB-MMP212]|uniref:hypothetical protein n=1 Tax=Bacillus sp. CCB-MMP212 TaxID=2928002 RepID=UPI001F612E38|nr:hypothetical protein [Bacillus sp. CCB-MMP212]MCI4252652.1 hypothetical protein [Bacillus sp. CCB-MMP212]